MKKPRPINCTVDGCTNKNKALGLCVKHWWRMRYHGDVNYMNHFKGPCAVSNCQDPAGHKGLCRNHVQQKDNKLKRDSGYKKKFESTIEQRYKQTKRSVISSGKAFDVTFAHCKELMLKNKCIYCSGKLPATRVGLDRINNSLGYTDDNVQACCYTCNRVKSDIFTHEEFKIISSTDAYNSMLLRGKKIKYGENK